MKRHRLSTRVWHWLNLLMVVVLFMSGLNISNAHRWLYWGDWGFDPKDAWLGVMRFPGWATIPGHYDLARARDWHLLAAFPFALGVLFMWIAMLANGHFWRDLRTRRAEWRWSAIGDDIRQHLRFKFDHSNAKYNFLQKLSYGVVVGILLPLMIVTGMGISPGWQPSLSWLIDLFGGRQSMRSIHFLAAWAIFGFFVIHVVMVLVSGPIRQLRDMISGGAGMKRRGVMAGLSALFLGACSKIADSRIGGSALSAAEDWQRMAQRFFNGDDALVKEYDRSEISPTFRGNGSTNPQDAAYRAHAANGFADWRLAVGGLVVKPLVFTLDDLRRLPQRSQITRHDCVEGWSAIGEWTGPQLGNVLRMAGLRDEARYIVFHCADTLNGSAYYESIDLADAFHPQTIIAHMLNRSPLPVKNGAPLRMRIERQLGYKHAKYVHSIEAVASLEGIGKGNGGYWEDRGYQWYAGA